MPSERHRGTWGQTEPCKGKAELLGRAMAAGDITQLLDVAAAQGKGKAHEKLGLREQSNNIMLIFVHFGTVYA